jgi:peptidoglycan/xylan/chitin deacetylase (PgdA/CDA1 family)
MNAGTRVGLLGASLGAAGMAWAVRGRSSQVFGPSVWRGQPGRRAIGLTFDDGPSAATLQILEILAAYGAAATFFQCGINVRRAPELSRAVFAGPHEIGNHSQTHPNFALKRPSYIAGEFREAQETIIGATGKTPVWMRPPYGVRWFGFREMQEELNLRCAMWTVIGQDWRLDAAAIADRVLTRPGDGGIICLHDGRGTLKDPDARQTVEAVRRIVPALLEKGYHFETVSQLVCRT